MKYWLSLIPVPEVDQLVPLARRAEELGFHGVAVADHLVMPTRYESRYPYTEDGEIFWPIDLPWPDPWVTLAAMASVTTELRLATNIYLGALRDPFTAAKAVATTAVLSGERVVCGLAAGWIREEYELLGLDFSSRGRRLDELIEVMRKLWSGREVSHRGEFFRFENALMAPAPREPVPVWVGGHSPGALRRAARSDGWFGLPMTREQLWPVVEELRRQRAEAGLDPETLELCFCLSEPLRPDAVAELEERGVEHLSIVCPWQPSPWEDTRWDEPGADPGRLEVKTDALARFAADVIGR